MSGRITIANRQTTLGHQWGPFPHCHTDQAARRRATSSRGG